MQHRTDASGGQAQYQASPSYYGAAYAAQPTQEASWAYYAWQQGQAAQAAAGQAQPQTQPYDYSAAWSAYFQQHGMAGYGYGAQPTAAAATGQPAAPTATPAAAAKPMEMYDPTQPTTTSYTAPSAPAYMSATPKVSFQLRPSNPSYSKVVQGLHKSESKAEQEKKAAGNGGAAAGGTNGWPPNLRAYVERAFSSCTTDQERNEMETVLKKVITQTMNDKSMWVKNWDSEPLPRLGAEQQQQQQQQKQKRPAGAEPGAAGEQTRKKMKKAPMASPQKAQSKLQLMSLGGGGNDKRALRSARFAEPDEIPKRRGGYLQPTVTIDADEQDWESMVIRGTCTTLEKEYLRLTSAPDPSTVRPEPVLKEALKALLAKYAAKPNYIYTCNQLKAIRQDLTVQHIKNGFAIKVYEKHARLALQNGDTYEFNACQSRLIELYDEVEGGGSVEEFTGYRILHSLYSNSMADVAFLMAELTPREREARPIAHALGVRATLAMSDYHNFFRLYKQTPHMGAHIIDLFIDKMRITALKIICKAYRPTIELTWLLSELSFNNRKKGVTFLRENGMVLDAKVKTEVDTRAFYTALITKHPDRPES